MGAAVGFRAAFCDVVGSIAFLRRQKPHEHGYAGVLSRGEEQPATPSLLIFMFSHQTILSLRLSAPGVPRALPSLGHFRDVHQVRNVMEAKHLLLRCLRGLQALRQRTPDIILVDAGMNNPEIKAELVRWMNEHPRLGKVRVQFPAGASWLGRWLKGLIRCEGALATNA
jgi:hypothetical protein